MSPSPRRLTFAVGTSLLTASLATVACADKTRVNVRPPEPEEHVNEGPARAPDESAPDASVDDATTDETEPEPGKEERTVNIREPN